jgi:hypothetical protein
MPTTTRASVQASIIYLILGAALGALMLVNGWLPLGPAIYYVRPAHVQFLVVGWLTQFILGVAWWLFPPLAFRLRARDYPRGQAQRGSEPLYWVAFALLNAGVVLYAAAEPVYSQTGAGVFGGLSALASAGLLAAALVFVMSLWKRVREMGRPRT